MLVFTTLKKGSPAFCHLAPSPSPPKDGGEGGSDSPPRKNVRLLFAFCSLNFLFYFFMRGDTAARYWRCKWPEAISQISAAAFQPLMNHGNPPNSNGYVILSNRSLGQPHCCSSVAERCGYAPSSRRVASPNLWLRHPRLFMRWLPVSREVRQAPAKNGRFLTFSHHFSRCGCGNFLGEDGGTKYLDKQTQAGVSGGGLEPVLNFS